MKKVKIIPVRWIPEKHDTDADGTPNYKDCDPWNPHKHARPFGIYPVGNNKYGVYQQTTLGASTVRKGNPVFVGSLYEAEEYLKQLAENPAFYAER